MRTHGHKEGSITHWVCWGGAREGQQEEWGGWGGITWGEMPDVGEVGMEAANHIAMCVPNPARSAHVLQNLKYNKKKIMDTAKKSR